MKYWQVCNYKLKLLSRFLKWSSLRCLFFQRMDEITRVTRMVSGGFRRGGMRGGMRGAPGKRRGANTAG